MSIQVCVFETNNRSVAARWRNQYPEGSKPSADEVYNKLMALPFNASKDAIDTVIGNDSWTGFACDYCLSRAYVAFRTDIGDSTVCFQCVRRMVDMIEGFQAAVKL